MTTAVLEASTSSEALWDRPSPLLQQWRLSAMELNVIAYVASAQQGEIFWFGENGFWFAHPIPEWARGMLRKISELGELEEDWDSYGARPIDRRCAVTAAEIILNLMDSEMPEPSIVATTGGGIQLEWHRAGADLEIEIQSPTKVEVFFEDGRTDEEKELSLSVNFMPLLPLLHRLTQGGTS